MYYVIWISYVIKETEGISNCAFTCIIDGNVDTHCTMYDARTANCKKQSAMTGVHPCSVLKALFSHDEGEIDSWTRILFASRRYFTETLKNQTFREVVYRRIQLFALQKDHCTRTIAIFPRTFRIKFKHFPKDQIVPSFGFLLKRDTHSNYCRLTGANGISSKIKLNWMSCAVKIPTGIDEGFG